MEKEICVRKMVHILVVKGVRLFLGHILTGLVERYTIRTIWRGKVEKKK